METTRDISHHASAFDLVAAQPWAIQPAMLETIAAIARREAPESIEAVEARLGRPLQNTRQVTLRDSTAIVPITGPIFRYANLFTEISGATSLEVLARDFQQAVDNPQVEKIVLAIDSPGGQANGIAELAQLIHGAPKPVVAYVDGMAASAAYWLASAADQIIVSKTAMVGSIGAVSTIDTRQADGRIELVSSQSPKKRPNLATDAGRAQLQAHLDHLAQVFIDDVAAYRHTTSERVATDFGQGDLLMGATAVAAGMADAVSTLETLLAGSPGAALGIAMSTEPTLPAAAPVATELLPQITAEDVETARQEGWTAGATAERERILGIQALSLPGHEALIAQLVADGTTTTAHAAVQILQAERAHNASRAQALAADAPAPVAHAAAPEPTAPVALPLPEQAAHNWSTDAKIQAEFSSLEAYTAYLKHTTAGRARVLGQPGA